MPASRNCLDEFGVDERWRQDSLSESATVARDNGQITIGKPWRDHVPKHCVPIRMGTRARKHDDRVTTTNAGWVDQTLMRADKPTADPDNRQDNGSIVPLRDRCFSTTPRTTSQIACQRRSLDDFPPTLLIFEPRGILDSQVE